MTTRKEAPGARVPGASSHLAGELVQELERAGWPALTVEVAEVVGVDVSDADVLDADVLEVGAFADLEADLSKEEDDVISELRGS